MPGIDLATTKLTAGTDSRQWLGSAHGTQSTRSITLHSADFLAAYPDGNVPSGVPLVVDSAGRATPATVAVVPHGYLYSPVTVRGTAKIGAALIERGRIRTQFLPAGITTTGRSPLFTYTSN